MNVSVLCYYQAMRFLVIAFVVSVLVGCGSSADDTAGPRIPVIIDAAVSGDGIMVGADVGVLHVNDGGKKRTVTFDGMIAYVLEPADLGVWVGAEGEAIFIHRDGESRYPINGIPEGILPAGDGTAYVITGGVTQFVGNGNYRNAAKRSWQRFGDTDELFHDLSQESGSERIHRFD